ncbi:MAG: hypothetical protein K0R60_61 [Microbacterium sp.]|jgi:hypothetical protein|nr:hypothetical protein [Microbacterium sp.]
MSDVLVLADDEVLVWPNGDPVDVESIEGYADDARLLASSALEDGEIRTPDWCIAELAAVSGMAARMTLVILKAEAFKRQAASRLNRAKAAARLKYSNLPGPQQTAHIVLDTTALQDEYDVAIAAFEYSRRMGNLLSDYTSRVQTMAKQIELTWMPAPTGRRGI